ncbi:CaiB/BaiF CoA transferase family protein [Parvularcula maris]|uniref:CoA transferase n=1 Tax=Parvularcula maris TaxID=2965077 RepID=A0A9X2RHY1_9PROT|nr:CaiB/BaiF CoA-transferase family protein [Parvularcula maris]MCQ8185384.1 CoA transferase [Parvularcula maris]
MTNLLQGIRVLDLTRLLPGPLCTLYMADQGAEVIKVEDEGAGDYARSEMAMGVSMSHLFHLLNRQKKSVTLDLREPEGRAALLRLVEAADVLVESFRPGVMDRLGLGSAVLREAKPDLIVCSMTAYGQTGPYRSQPAHDNNMLALTGIADQLPRAAGGEIGSPNFQIADIAGGSLTALSSIAMALFRRERTGEGATLDISLAEAALAAAVMPLATMQLRGGETPPPGGDMLTGLLPCYRYYETKDGRQIAMGALEGKFWRAFCEAAGRQDLADKGRDMTRGEGSTHHQTELLFRSRTFDEWRALLEGLEACVTPVLTLSEALNDPHLEERRVFYDVHDHEDGAIRHVASPIVVDGKRARPGQPAPRQGEHNEEILGSRTPGAKA